MLVHGHDEADLLARNELSAPFPELRFEKGRCGVELVQVELQGLRLALWRGFVPGYFFLYFKSGRQHGAGFTGQPFRPNAAGNGDLRQAA